MSRIAWIAAGGAVGAVLRYWLSGLTHRFVPGIFPWGTLCVNLAGAFVIGLLWGVSEVASFSSHFKLLIFVGLLGAFTTFSTFALENFSLLRDGETGLALVNIFASNVLGIVVVYGGFFAARYFLGLSR